MLYVLDEPSIGLHPARRRPAGRRDPAAPRSRQHGRRRRARRGDDPRGRSGRSRSAPARASAAAQVVFQGTPAEMEAVAREPHRRLPGRPARRRRHGRRRRRRITAGSGWPARAATICKNVTVEFPLGVLCLVTGVSGAGKSTLVEDTLYPALCRRLRKDAPKPLPLRRRVRRRPDRRRDPGRSEPDRPLAALATRSRTSRRSTRSATCSPTRSKPARGTTRPAISASTSTAAAATPARATATSQIDMQFLADVYMKCRQCHGTPLSRRDPGRHLPRPQHRRSARHDRPRGVHLLPRPAQGAGPAEAADRRGPRLPAARPAGQHALRRRGPAAEAGRLHVGPPSAAARCSSSTSRPPACTSPTSCNCSIASTPCWPSAIR